MQSLGKQAYDAIKAAVLGRGIITGNTYTQAELCQIIGLSTNPVREALKILEHEGFVKIRARSGILIVKPDLAYFSEIYQLRRILELAAIEGFVAGAPRDAVLTMREDHLKQREAAVANTPLADLMPTQQLLEERLHGGIIDSLRNASVSKIHRLNYQKVRIVRMDMAGYTNRHVVETMDEHLAVLDCAHAGDFDGARKALDGHLKAALERSLICAGSG